MESNVVDAQGAQDHEDCVVSSSDVEPPFQVKSAAGKLQAATDDDERAVNAGGVHALRPGSLTLIENLEKSRRETVAKSSVTGFVVQTDVRPTTTVRSLPKALQPKEARLGTQPLQPSSPPSGYRVATGSQLSSGINVSDSVLRQQRHGSSSGASGSPTSPSPRLTRHLSAKPEVSLERPETEKNSSAPNVGLATLRSGQRQHVTKETTKSSYRPQVQTLLGGGHRSVPFSDLLSVFQSPSSTISGPKSASYTTTPSKYSKLNRFTFDDHNESPSAITTEPIDSSVSNDAVFDPSPTISRMLRKQQTGAAVHAGRKPLETQASCPELKPVTPKPVIQIQDSVTSPAGKESCNAASSSIGVTSDPLQLSSNSVDSNNSSSTCVGVELQLPDKQESNCSNVLSASDGELVGTNMVEQTTTNKVADDDRNVEDDDDNDKDDKVMETLTSGLEDNSQNSNVKDASSSSLADIASPPMYLPLHIDVISHHDHDR